MDKFTAADLPFAYAILAAAGRLKPRRDGRHPVEKFFLTWMAFDAIYSAVARRNGVMTELVTAPDGTVATTPNGSVRIPEVLPVSARQQIGQVLGELDGSLKDSLIAHPSTPYFAGRVPFWQGKKIAQDAMGQKLNGVIHVTHTTSAAYPVWSPIDNQVLERYLAAPNNAEERDFLTGQIVDLLYTIRENLSQVGSVFDDANDIAVYEHALPLLEMIVTAFLG